MTDLSQINLNEFKDELKTGRLLPSRKPLLEDIDQKFNQIEKSGINNAENLRKILSSSSKLEKLADKTNISETYLKLLNREVNNLLPTPIKFSDIPEISENIVTKLNTLGITNTEALFPFIKDINSRKEFKNTSGFSNEEIQWLTKIVDVSRIKWAGPKLAGLILDTKYDTVEKLANAKPAEVLKALNDAKNKNKNYKGALGINDIDSWIRQVVSKIPLVIEY